MPMTKTAILNASGIDKRFGALVVLENVDFAVAENEVMGKAKRSIKTRGKKSL